MKKYLLSTAAALSLLASPAHAQMATVAEVFVVHGIPGQDLGAPAS
jgi:hypothetical protein